MNKDKDMNKDTGNSILKIIYGSIFGIAIFII